MLDIEAGFELLHRRYMGELIESEVRVQFVIDPAQDVEIEGGGHALAVVVRALQQRARLSHIRSDQDGKAGTAHGEHASGAA